MADTAYVHMIDRALDLRSTVRVASLTLAMLLIASVRLSTAQWNSVEVCNTGKVTFSVAVVEMSESTILSDRFNGEGWWKVTSGDCKVVFHKAYLDISTAFLAFSYVDRFGTAGIAQVNPSPDTDEFLSSYQSNLRASTRFFCGTQGGFRLINHQLASAQDCPEMGSPTPKLDANGNEWFRVPYTVRFAPDWNGRDDRSYTFKVSIDPNTPVWRPFPTRNGTATPAAIASPPPTMVAPARPAVPRAFERDTFTATFIGKTVVRWLQPDAQLYYDDGTAVQLAPRAISDHEARAYNVYNLGFFDWPPPYANFPENVVGLLKNLQSSDAEEIRLGSDGRLTVFSSDGSMFRTLSLQSLNLAYAIYRWGQFLQVPCRYLWECVYNSGGAGGQSSLLLLDVGTEERYQNAVAALGELQKLFGTSSVAIRVDAACSCWRYDVLARGPPTVVSTEQGEKEKEAFASTLPATDNGNIEPAVNAGNRATGSGFGLSALAAFIPLLVVSCGVVWALRRGVKLGS